MTTRTDRQRDNKQDDMAVVVAVIAQKIETIQIATGEIQKKLDSNYATKEWISSEYGDTKKQVSYLIYTFSAAIIGAIATFIIRGGLK